MGADEDSAVVHYGMVVSTALTLRTGCHVDHVWPLPLPGPSSTQVPTW